MRNLKTFDSIANDVMMTRSGKTDHSAILLEGWDDQRFYRNYLHVKSISFALDGRSEVTGTIAVLMKRGQVGAVGVIDADCDHLDRVVCPRNILRSDFRDLECFLISSPALTKVLHEHLIQDDFQDLRKKLFKACRDLGILRWRVASNGWSVDFKHLEFERFVDPVSLAASRLELCREVLRQNPYFKVAEEELVNEIHLADDDKISGAHACSGHDVCAVLAMWVTNRTNYKVTRSNVEQQLRLAVDLASFLRTKFVDQVRTWEAENTPFRVLKDFIPVKPANASA